MNLICGAFQLFETTVCSAFVYTPSPFLPASIALHSLYCTYSIQYCAMLQSQSIGSQLVLHRSSALLLSSPLSYIAVLCSVVLCCSELSLLLHRATQTLISTQTSLHQRSPLGTDLPFIFIFYFKIENFLQRTKKIVETKQ